VARMERSEIRDIGKTAPALRFAPCGLQALCYKRAMSKFLIAALLALATLPAHADDYPSRNIEIIVPFAAGGGTDLIGRVLAQRLGEQMGRRVVILNRPGASTNIGTAAVANAAPDGYTLLLTSISFAANPSLYRRLAYQQSDFAPIMLIANSPSVLVATRS